MDPKPSEYNLKNLIDKIESSQKHNIRDFSVGHLNESKLYKPPKSFEHTSWQSSKSLRSPVARSRKVATRTKAQAKMTDALQYFTMGGTVVTPEVPKIRIGTKGPVHLNQAVGSQGSYSQLDDGIFIENMGQAETMIVNTRYPQSPEVGIVSVTPLDEDTLKEVKEVNATQLHHKFIPSHLQAITKKDQYKSLMAFENVVLKKQDALEQNVMSGVKAAEHLEDRLQKVFKLG